MNILKNKHKNYFKTSLVIFMEFKQILSLNCNMKGVGQNIMCPAS